MSDSLEQAVVFESGAESLYGLLHLPEQTNADVGVVILVGGPQYRVGSHRQFVELARGLASAGIPVFRFDFTGMGDSTGYFPGFENVNGDIRQAIDTLVDSRPEIKRIILWGLCDGASAACFYASQDQRVIGLCLANPWVRTEQGEAKAFLKHYYLSRLMNKQFWMKLLTGKLKVFQAVLDLISNVKRSRVVSPEVVTAEDKIDADISSSSQSAALPDRVFQSLALFPGKIMFLISGNDLTAAEFMDSVANDRKRQKLMSSHKVTLTRFPEANHTFSRREWMHDVIKQTAHWIKSL